MCPECLYAEDALTGFEEGRGILSVPYVRARAVTGKPLPAMQAALLQYLRANPGRVIGRDELAQRVWKQRTFTAAAPSIRPWPICASNCIAPTRKSSACGQ